MELCDRPARAWGSALGALPSAFRPASVAGARCSRVPAMALVRLHTRCSPRTRGCSSCCNPFASGKVRVQPLPALSRRRAWFLGQPDFAARAKREVKGRVLGGWWGYQHSRNAVGAVLGALTGMVEGGVILPFVPALPHPITEGPLPSNSGRERKGRCRAPRWNGRTGPLRQETDPPAGESGRSPVLAIGRSSADARCTFPPSYCLQH